MSNKITEEQLIQLTEFLQGTCMNTLDSAIKELFGDEYSEDDLTDSDYNFIDNEIFNCAECGWWCEISESEDYEDENICSDCMSDKDE